MAELTQIFSIYKDAPIALYGLGVETEKVLREMDQKFQIIGLLDSFRTDGVLYGKRILSLEEILKNHVSLIIVVARPGSCRAIAMKMRNFCFENGIALLDINGRDLIHNEKISFEFNGINGITRRELRDLASNYQVITFDLFDTLIMRKVISSVDIIQLTNMQLHEKNIFISDFCQKRLKCEKDLSNTSAPHLTDIYKALLEEEHLSIITPQELANLEWSIDCSVLVPRKDVVEFMHDLFLQGKEIYIVTDSYYTEEQITIILDKCKISTYTKILVSSEYGTSKPQDLFGILKKLISNKSCLHIGDDDYADIKNAKRYNLSAIRLYSAVDLFEMAGYLGLQENLDCLASRIKIGLFLERLFNSPFQFEQQEKKISVKDGFTIGYIFFAPIISDFVVWFYRQVMQQNIENVWFGSRDGYLIQKMYKIIQEDNPSVYFLTSRTAVLRAGMRSKKDIQYVSDMKYSGTLQSQLAERFGVQVHEKEIEDKMLSDFSEEIIKLSKKKRIGYEKYIHTLNIQRGSVVFFDFVAKGTTQLYLSRLVENHIKGLYFLQLEKEYMEKERLDIQSFYDGNEMDGNKIYEEYYIMEPILTSPMPSVLEFDNDGCVRYDKETRKKADIEYVKEIQEGIIEYFRTYIRLCPKQLIEINKNLDEKFLDFIHKISILDKGFWNLKVEDPFFNRTTNISDLI